jgi:hypothetical protein
MRNSTRGNQSSTKKQTAASASSHRMAYPRRLLDGHAFYAAYHRHPVNQARHVACIASISIVKLSILPYPQQTMISPV